MVVSGLVLLVHAGGARSGQRPVGSRASWAVRSPAQWHRPRKQVELRPSATLPHHQAKLEGSDAQAGHTPRSSFFCLGDMGTCLTENSWGSSSR